MKNYFSWWIFPIMGIKAKKDFMRQANKEQQQIAIEINKIRDYIINMKITGR